LLLYALRRVLTAVPLLLGVATIVFLVLALAPGDPASFYLTPGMSPEVLEQIRRNLGLDAPLHVQYGRWLLSFLQGDFGQSLAGGMPVRDRILAVLPNTLLLATVALGLAFAAGVVLGVIQAARRHSLLDSVATGTSLLFYSMPSFWLAIMMILVFSVNAGNVWNWPVSFPPSGITSDGYELMGTADQIRDRIRHLTLPALTLALVLAGGIARYVRNSMLEVLGQDYIRTARAKGLPEWMVVWKHALRNALIPVVTLLGVYLPLLLGGAVFVEYVFAWPGMGRLMVESILLEDYPVVLAGSFLFGGMVVLGNLLADLLYGVVDPRIRHGQG
jgi:peptide/nickel transport system permease protein